jgi:phage replication O-like protein O
MNPLPPDRFVRFPTELFDVLLRVRLSGVQFRIVLWVARQTFGWHRSLTPYSWYRIAQELRLDRGGVVRAGRELLRTGVLYQEERGLRIKPIKLPATSVGEPCLSDDSRHRRGVSADSNHRKAMPDVSGTDDSNHRKRGHGSSFLRRAKERFKKRERKKETCGSVVDHRIPCERSETLENTSLTDTLVTTGAPSPEYCAGCSRKVPLEWCAAQIVSGRPLAGTGVWRSQLLDDRCPECSSSSSQPPCA